MILLLILLYPILVSVTLLILNDLALLPFTENYRLEQAMRQETLSLERARAAVIEARYRARENEHIDQVLMIEQAK
jgi:hypothetical protein